MPRKRPYFHVGFKIWISPEGQLITVRESLLCLTILYNSLFNILIHHFLCFLHQKPSGFDGGFVALFPHLTEGLHNCSQCIPSLFQTDTWPPTLVLSSSQVFSAEDGTQNMNTWKRAKVSICSHSCGEYLKWIEANCRSRQGECDSKWEGASSSQPCFFFLFLISFSSSSLSQN